MAWTADTGADVTSAFRGVSTPLRELYDEVHGRGWDVQKIAVKDGQYAAKIKSPHGEEIEKVGPDAQTALAHCLVALMRQETARFITRTAAWSTTWVDQLAPIAKAYAEAPVYDPKAASAWKELADDCISRAQAISNQIKVEFTDDPHPYEDVAEMAEDIKKNKKIQVSRANAHHPLWSLDQVLAYRLVHDVLGHAVSGGDWGWHGENNATAAHMPLLSPQAQKALFTEAIGQTAHNHYYRGIGPQKIIFLDDHLQDAQDAENSAGHGGVHPSQTIVPSIIPDITKKSSDERLDPNYGWESGLDPLPDNAYLWQKEITGLDPLDHQGVKDAARQVDSGWFNTHHHDGSPDLDSQRQAVVNAFRGVLLNPRKPWRWNATHYQHINHIPATVSDPLRFFDALESQREAHNQARGLPEGIHRNDWSEQRGMLKQWIKGLHPSMDDAQVDEIARRELFHMTAEEEERVAANDPTGELTTAQISEEVGKALRKRLQVATKPRIDTKFDFGNDRLFAEASHPNPGVYGHFLASHLRPIAGVGLHANDLLRFAREDVSDHKGKGHHFRSQVLGLIPGVGPKEIGYAWMLLQPHSSELAVIDPSIAQALGHEPDKTHDRDYFKMERQLAAGRDAAGYTHVPLGQFGWGLWDYMNYGHGMHRDHRPLHVSDPVPHEHVNWDNQPTAPVEKWSDPYWWKSTEPARDEIGKQWDQMVAVNHPKHEVPWRMAKTASVRNFEIIWNSYDQIWPAAAEKLSRRAKMCGLTRAQASAFIAEHSDKFAFDKIRQEFTERFFKIWKTGGLEDHAPSVKHPDGEWDVGAPGEGYMRYLKMNYPALSTVELWKLIEEAEKVK